MMDDCAKRIVANILATCEHYDWADLAVRTDLEGQIEELNVVPDLLKRQFEETLSKLAINEATSLNTSQQFILGQNEFGAVRINLWPTFAETGAPSEQDLKIYSYLEAHDHNFDFLTIGHYGPGYETDIYIYDRDQVEGYPGEKVDIAFHKRTRLGVGDKLWFQSGVQIHTQELPSSLSASINIILKSDDEYSKPQFYFDIASSTILRLTSNTTSKQKNLLELCALVDSARSREIIEHYAANSDNLILRTHAESLLQPA